MNKIKSIQHVLFVIMKITVTQLLLMTILTTLVSAEVLKGQGVLDKRITLVADGLEVRTLLNEIESKAEVAFTYSPKLIKKLPKVTLSVKQAKLSEVLNQIFSPSIEFFLVNEEIVLKATEEEEKVSNIIQLSQITGKITDENGVGLPGVNVVVKGSTNGTVTDAEGNYTLEVPSSESVLVFSSIGYATEEVAVGSQSIVDVLMTVDIQTLSEIVVVGYGTVKKSDLTGSVSSVKATELTAFPVANATQALQGRAAGVSVQANNGDPGGSLKVRIRGGNSINASSDPLYVVDGFIGGSLPAPEDIQSIEVLKDASATAIYGSRGANGVIMVTTKTGKPGKTTIQFNTSFSSQKVIKRLDLLNAEQFLDYTREVIPAYVDHGANTDWQDQIFHSGGIKNYQVSVAGGSEAVNYYVSGSVFDQNGIIRGSAFDRYSITSNVNFKVSKKVSAGVNLLARRTGRDGVVTQEGSGGAGGAGVVGSSLRFMPDLPVRNPNGSFTLASIGDPIDNPYAVATERQQETIGDLFQSNFYLNIDIIKNLSFKTTLGFKTQSDRTGIFVPTTLYAGANVGGDAQISALKNTDVISENYFTYNWDLNPTNKLTFLAGYSLQKSTDTNWLAGSQSFVTNSVSFWNLQGGAVPKIPTSGFSETQIQSFFGRVNYSFNSKYLLTVNARYDGSSNFSKNNKYAFFPSAALAWNMKDEAFLSDVDVISEFKWRVSYGLTGNQAISPYQTLARFSNSYTIIDGSPVNAVRPTSVANDDLTWETTGQLDIGVDVSFLNSRLSITADYYRSVTSDLLFSVPLPSYTGFSNQLQNLGKVENKGIEFALNTVNTTGDFKWNTSFNISGNRNKVLELPDGNDVLYGSGPGHLIGLGKQTQILRVGEPVGSFYGWIYDGVYQQGDTFTPGGGFEQVAGGEKFRDIDGEKDANGKLTGNPDGKLTADDRTIIGNGQPKFIWGLNNDFSYKGFDLNIFFQASQGNQILSYTLLEIETLSGSNNSTTRALDRWTPDHTDTDVPKRTLTRSQRVSSRWIFDGSFIRLKNISLGYSLPASLIENIGISKIRFYVSAQNILTFTDYKGFDPEVNYNSASGGDSNRNLGLDYASYPNAKSFTVGLNVGF